MKWIEFLFWFSALVLVYTYIGYPLLLFVWVSWKERGRSRKATTVEHWPSVTLIVAAYNEDQCIAAKLDNSLALDYPSEQLEIWVVSDGSTDRTNELVQKCPDVKLFFEPVRKGKLHAIQRVMAQVRSQWVVFSDANAMVVPGAIRSLMEAGMDDKVGAVAGEKKVRAGRGGGGGESLYWKYESLIKEWEGRFYSVTGTAGELYAIKTSLFVPVSEGTISDDLEIGWAITEQGHRIAYVQSAMCLENEPDNFSPAFRRRVRIAGGSVQSVLRLLRKGKRGWPYIFWWEVISHRVLRAVVAPYCLVLLVVLNVWLVSFHSVYEMLLLGQWICLGVAFLFWWLRPGGFIGRLMVLPFFFLMAHWAMIRGAWLLMQGRQSVLWERIPRGSSENK
jgi:biofilm PGA synthesis N-glycosyltransferase PgaC